MSKIIISVLAMLVAISLPTAFHIDMVTSFPNEMLVGQNYHAIFNYSSPAPSRYFAFVKAPMEADVWLDNTLCARYPTGFNCSSDLKAGANLITVNITFQTAASRQIDVQFFLPDQPVVTTTFLKTNVQNASVQNASKNVTNVTSSNTEKPNITTITTVSKSTSVKGNTSVILISKNTTIINNTLKNASNEKMTIVKIWYQDPIVWAVTAGSLLILAALKVAL